MKLMKEIIALETYLKVLGVNTDKITISKMMDINVLVKKAIKN